MFFWARGDVERFLQDLGLKRLLAQQPMQFADLVLKCPIVRSRNNLFLGTRRSQRTLVRTDGAT